jgi:hypothetical protein
MPLPPVLAELVARFRTTTPDTLPVNAEAPKVIIQGLASPSTELVTVHNPYKPGVTGHGLPSVAAPERAGVPPSHLLGVAMRALEPRGMSGTVHPHVPVGKTVLPPATGGPGHPVVALPRVPLLAGDSLPAVGKGTVPRWA